MLFVFLSVIFQLQTQDVTGVTMEGCPDGWMAHGQYCYMFMLDEKSFFKANKACGGDATLVSIWNLDEWDFVTQGQWSFSHPSGNETDESDVTTTVASPVTDATVAKEGHLWTGFRRVFNVYSMNFVWAWKDMSSPRNVIWASAEDENYNATDKCIGGVLDLKNMTMLAKDCSYRPNGYICKTAAPRGFYMGAVPNDTITARQTEMILPLARATFFTQVQDIGQVFSVTSFLFELPSVDEQQCATICLGDLRCRYFEILCRTSSKVCDSKTCNFRGIPY